MHSISDLTTTCRRTAGHVPPRLVGASTTVVGSKMYLFGGRLVAERTMISALHIFDLKTYYWEEPTRPPPEEEQPPARYFHSADQWGNTIVVFGGMGNNPDSMDPEDLIVLNDVWLYDITTGRWHSGLPTPGSDRFLPRARYAHLSAITSDTLFVIGGQDINNVWLDEVCAYDLKRRSWVSRRAYPRHCGTYRSIAVAPQLSVVSPQAQMGISAWGAPGTRFSSDGVQPPSQESYTASESFTPLSYSTPPPPDAPSDIYLYSNYNFTDVRRELEVLSPLPGLDADITISDRSSTMSGTSLPPGLRFPSGAVIGQYLILTGTYLAHTFQTYSIWALDLTTNIWHRIDPGAPLTSGSWFRSCLWTEGNRLLVFGDRHGSLVEDYNRRLLCWEDVATIDLEAFGFYQPPPRTLDIPAQELGLAMLEEGVLADFELVAEDGRKVRCSRRLLEERWPWFAEQRRRFVSDAMDAAGPGASASAAPLPELARPEGDEERPDPRLTPRSFHFTEPYAIVLAFAQYLYTQALITPLQHAPVVLSQLLLFSSLYSLPQLRVLCVHAMHGALSKSTSVGVYEVATLCGCRSLQIRALKTVMAYNSKKSSRQSRRQRPRENGDRDGNGGGRPNGDGGGAGGYNGGDGGGDGGSRSGSSGGARPRGTSDASFMRPGMMNGTGGANGAHAFQASQGDPQGRVATSSSHPPLVIRKKTPPEGQVPEHDRSTSVDIGQLQDLLAAANLHGENFLDENEARRRADATSRMGASRPATIVDADQYKPLPSLPGQSRRPDFYLPLEANGAMRPRPRLDTTGDGISPSQASASALSPTSIPPTPGLSAALMPSPLSAISTGPATPPGFSPGPSKVPSSARVLRSPSLLSMSPTDNPFQVRRAPPPPVPRVGALRTYTSMNNLSDAGPECQDDDLSPLPGFAEKHIEKQIRPRGGSLSRNLWSRAQAPPATTTDKWENWEEKDSWARVAR